MGVQKRPKLCVSQLADGSEFYFFRKPITGKLSKKPGVVTPTRAPMRVAKSASREKKSQRED